MDTKEQFEKFLKRYPHPHHLISEKPHLTRRHLFQLAGTGLSMGWLAGKLRADGPVITETPVTTINKARNVVFILLTGAPSHTDTLDYKATPDKPADLLKPATMNGILWPSGILPKLGEQLGDVAIIRSARSWALVHGLSQTWYQIGRNPAAALGDIAPNLGSIVAIEKEADRRPGPDLSFVPGAECSERDRVRLPAERLCTVPRGPCAGGNPKHRESGRPHGRRSDERSRSTARHARWLATRHGSLRPGPCRHGRLLQGGSGHDVQPGGNQRVHLHD